MAIPDPRARYVADSVGTASPGRLLVMLFDRLLLDHDRALDALTAGDRSKADAALRHAQDIVLELRGSLDVAAWSGGPGLAALYDFLLRELLRAQLRGDAAVVVSCRELVAPLAEAWREAATVTAASRPQAGVAGRASVAARG